MTLNLVDSVRGVLGDDVLGQAAKLIGENPVAVKSATTMLVPTLIGGLAQQGSTAGGAAALLDTLRSPAVDANIASNLPGLLLGGQSTSSLLAQGSTLARAVFGERVGTVTDTVASLTGVRPTGASSLLFMLAPAALGVLKSHALKTGLDAGGLQQLLGAQASSLTSAVDPRLARAAGLGSLIPDVPRARDAVPAAVAATTESEPRRSWIPIAALAAAALLLFALLRGRAHESPSPSAAGDTAASASASDSTTHSTAAAEIAPASVAGLPATAYFPAGSATLEGADKQTVVAAGQAVASSGAHIAITGYTDQSGDHAKNVELAKNRAKAVRNVLTAVGVPATKITMKPPADVTGSGSDKEARRVEITVAQP